MTVTLTNLRVSKYMTTRLLKSTDTTTFQVSDKEMSIDPKDLRDANSKSITATIVSVDLTSLNKHLVCLKCTQIVVLLDESSFQKSSFHSPDIQIFEFFSFHYISTSHKGS